LWKVVEEYTDMAGESVPIPQPHNLKEKAREEFKRFVAIFLYLWVVFGLLSIHKSLVLSQQHLDHEEHTFAIINALVFAKVLLVGEELHLGRRFQNRPLIYPVLYKCLVFSVVLIFFHAVESTAVGMWHGNTLTASIPPILGWNPKGLLAVGFSCFVLLIPFFGFREMARVLGRGEMRNLLFGKK
jgi:hypothetical protein